MAKTIEMKKEPTTMLTARVPTKLVNALDRVRAKEHRTRSAEVIVRLQASLKADRKRDPV